MGEIVSLVLIVYGLIGLAIAGTQSTQSLEHEISDIENELDLLAIPVTSHEQKAQKLLRIQQIQLKRYYDQALNQSTLILFVGIAAMILGFTVIAYTLYYVGVPRITDSQVAFEEKIIVGVLGAVGGILSNFIGVMYTKMFSEIVQTLNRSFSALVATYRYNFANVLAANIRDDVLREKTLSDLALAARTPTASGVASEAHHVTANPG